MDDTEKRPNPLAVFLIGSIVVAFGALWVFILFMFLSYGFPKYPPLSGLEKGLVFIVPLVLSCGSAFILFRYTRNPAMFDGYKSGGYESE